jgi:hypothetical protein
VSTAQRQALLAVQHGAVHVGAWRVYYPPAVSRIALQRAYKAGLWAWRTHPEHGQEAVLTASGRKALA